ncbi:MAG: hypothetical protein R3B09_35790, partial [Nannocystaceae bacterium]
MATAIESLTPLLEALRGRTESLGKFVSAVAAAEQAAKKQDNPAYMAALTRIQTGAVAMGKAMVEEGWGWASRYRLDVWLRIYKALSAYNTNPADALLKADGTGPAVGYATAQLWADLAVEVIRGEWDEAKKRRALKEAEIAMFALGPAGVVVALYKLDEPFDLGIADALGLDELGKAVDDFRRDTQEKVDDTWRTVKIAAGVTAGIAGLFG